MPFNRIQFIAPIPGQEGYQDYLEGRGRLGEAGEINRSTETVIIGQQCLLAPYKASGRYQGRILHPERRGEEWSFQANMLFFAGVITARRSVFLIPSPSRDPRYASGGIIYPETFTTDELLWLRDNHYTFKSSVQDGLDPVQGILATPPPVLARTRAPIPIFRNYQIDKTLSKSSQDRILKEKLEELMKIDILTDSMASTQHSITISFAEHFSKIKTDLEDEEAFIKRFAGTDETQTPDRTPPRCGIKGSIPEETESPSRLLARLRLVDKARHRERVSGEKYLSSLENRKDIDDELPPDPKRRRTSGGSPRFLTERYDGTITPPKEPMTLGSRG